MVESIYAFMLLCGAAWVLDRVITKVMDQI